MVASNSKGKWLWNLACLTFHFELPKVLVTCNHHKILELTSACRGASGPGRAESLILLQALVEKEAFISSPPQISLKRRELLSIHLEAKMHAEFFWPLFSSFFHSLGYSLEYVIWWIFGKINDITDLVTITHSFCYSCLGIQVFSTWKLAPVGETCTYYGKLCFPDSFPNN